MAYSNSPYLPKARRQAVNLVRKEGFSLVVAAKKSGVSRVTLHRWLKLAKDLHGVAGIPTASSKPKNCPWALDPEITGRIISLRKQHKRCSAVIRELLRREGVVISESSVHRTLSRAGLLKKKHGKPNRPEFKRVERPEVKEPGDLVEVDTIHLKERGYGRSDVRFYVYTLIDLQSRWAHAEVHPRLSPVISAAFVARAQKRFGRPFKMIQTDHGSEFSKTFEKLLTQLGIPQRRYRLGKKNDNAHVERFNRTIQEECIGPFPDLSVTRRDIALWLDFYNNERLHLGLQFGTPLEVLQRS